MSGEASCRRLSRCSPGSGDAVFYEGSGTPKRRARMTRLVVELIRPYRTWLVIVLVAMLLESR